MNAELVDLGPVALLRVKLVALGPQFPDRAPRVVDRADADVQHLGHGLNVSSAAASQYDAGELTETEYQVAVEGLFDNCYSDLPSVAIWPPWPARLAMMWDGEVPEASLSGSSFRTRRPRLAERQAVTRLEMDACPRVPL